jgi:DNA invertase Pin-like site-specific DNA recombinase
MTAAIIYCRYSPRPSRATGPPLSNEVQEAACRRYCDLRGLDVAAVFRDDGLSGRSDDRPGFRDALAAALKCRGVLVVYSLSRAFRSLRQAATTADLLRDGKSALVSVSESLDTSTAMGRCIYGIIAALAQCEAEITSERTSAALRHHQANGRRMSFRVPYGYEAFGTRHPVSGKHSQLRPVEAEQRICRLIVELRHAGNGHKALARELNNRGYDCRGKPWHAHTVRAVLRRMAYEAAQTRGRPAP